MSKIERGLFSDLLRRYLGMTGESDVAGELAPEISPILLLEAERPEWEFLKSNRLMSCPFGLAANAGAHGTHQLRNPAASGVVAVITLVSISVENQAGSTAFVSFFRSVEGADLANNTPTISRDTRYLGVNTSALIGSAEATAATGDTWYSIRILNNTPLDVGLAFVLTPGNQVQISTLQNNVEIRGGWQWLEKRIDALELR